MKYWKQIAVAALAFTAITFTAKSLATISNLNTKTVSSVGDGANKSFVIGFVFQGNDEVHTYLINDADLSFSEVTQGAGASKFTVGGGDPGTTVVMGTAPTSAQHLVIQRQTERTQTVDYDPNAAFPATDHEEQMDKFAQLMQEIYSGFSAVPQLSLGDTDTPAAGDVLRFGGSYWQYYSLSSALNSAFSAYKTISTVNGSTTADSSSDILAITSGDSSVTIVATNDSLKLSVSSLGSSVFAASSIALSKLQGGLPKQVVITDSSGVPTMASVLSRDKGGTGNSTMPLNGLLFADTATTTSAVPVQAAYQVYQTGSSGVPYLDAVQLSQSGATVGQLLASRGGTGVDSGSSSGVARIFAGRWEIGIVGASYGGTGNASYVLGDTLTGKVDGSLNRLARGSDGQILTVDSTQTGGIKWATNGALTISQSNNIQNLGLSAHLSGTSLAIEVKQADGFTAPASGTGAVNIGYKLTATGGAYTTVSSTSDGLSVVIPASATLGMANNGSHFLLVYGINVAGTTEVAVSQANFDDGSSATTVAITSGANSAAVLYSTTARTGVPIRKIGRLAIVEPTAGTHVNPKETALLPFKDPTVAALWGSTNNTTFNASIESPVIFNVKSFDTHSMYQTGINAFVLPETGIYEISTQVECDSDVVDAANKRMNINLYQNTVNILSLKTPTWAATTTALISNGTFMFQGTLGDSVQLKMVQTTTGSCTLAANTALVWAAIRKLPGTGVGQ